MSYNKKSFSYLLIISLVFGALVYAKYGGNNPVPSGGIVEKSDYTISEQKKKEYIMATDIIQSISGKFQQENYPTIDNYLSVALRTHPEFQEKYGSPITILGSVPFYGSNGKIKAYEYILISNSMVVGSIYEALLPQITFQDDKTRFFVPHFSVALALAKTTDTILGNKYFHDGICVENSTKIYCIPEEKPSIKGIHELIERIDTGNNQFYGLESKIKEYFGTGGFYSFGERGDVYFDPRTNRVFAPMPGSIMTYDDLR